jgi:2-iminobutanoate/2-iminopropanoate deaminase
MNIIIITTTNAPAPIGPYNQAIEANGTIYISGQIALLPGTDNLLTDDLETETHQVMKNLQAILTEAGITFDNIVKTSIFLKSMDMFATVNTVYASYLTGNYPARETVAVVGLPKNVNVEISMIAVR